MLGRFIDEQKPRDVFFFEQGGSFVIRMLGSTGTGAQHTLAEFTPDDIEQMITQGPGWRNPARSTTPTAAASGGAAPAKG